MQEQQVTVIARSWDAAVPMGVSHVEHFKSLLVTMVMTYFSAGMKGVFLLHPLVAVVLSISDPLRYGNFKWNSGSADPQLIGDIGGIEIWVEASVGSEILVTDGPHDLQPRASIRLNNFDFAIPPHPLERLAHIQ